MLRTILVSLGVSILAVAIGLFIGLNFKGGTGVYNSALVIKSSVVSQVIQNELLKRFGKEESELNAKIRTFQEDQATFNKQSATLSATERENRQKALIKRQRELDGSRRALVTESNRIKLIMDRQVTKLMFQAAEQVGKAHKFDLMIDTMRTGVTYLKPKYDLSNEMTNVLNSLWKSSGGKFTGLDVSMKSAPSTDSQASANRYVDQTRQQASTR